MNEKNLQTHKIPIYQKGLRKYLLVSMEHGDTKQLGAHLGWRMTHGSGTGMGTLMPTMPTSTSDWYLSR